VTVNNENILLMDSASVQPGSRFEVMASSKHPAPLQGFSLAFLYDRSVLSYENATFAGTAVAQAVKPQTIEFFQAQLELDFDPVLARMTVGAVVDYVPPFAGQIIPASPSQFQSMVRFIFQSKADPSLIGTCTDLTFQNGGVASVNNIFVIDKLSYAPALIDGKVCFGGKPAFARGKINGDNRVDLSDAIFLLGHLFLGLEAPGCHSAADVNDDGGVDISDAISLFNYLFIGGFLPREPFGLCGQDPTPDDLSCGISPCQ
jgi:hypothetical protein